MELNLQKPAPHPPFWEHTHTTMQYPSPSPKKLYFQAYMIEKVVVRNLFSTEDTNVKHTKIAPIYSQYLIINYLHKIFKNAKQQSLFF
jgi:hypothetical protein